MLNEKKLHVKGAELLVGKGNLAQVRGYRALSLIIKLSYFSGARQFLMPCTERPHSRRRLRARTKPIRWTGYTQFSRTSFQPKQVSLPKKGRWWRLGHTSLGSQTLAEEVAALSALASVLGRRVQMCHPDRLQEFGMSTWHINGILP
jgi:hypothetical protein